MCPYKCTSTAIAFVMANRCGCVWMCVRNNCNRLTKSSLGNISSQCAMKCSTCEVRTGIRNCTKAYPKSYKSLRRFRLDFSSRSPHPCFSNWQYARTNLTRLHCGWRGGLVDHVLTRSIHLNAPFIIPLTTSSWPARQRVVGNGESEVWPRKQTCQLWGEAK